MDVRAERPQGRDMAEAVLKQIFFKYRHALRNGHGGHQGRLRIRRKAVIRRGADRPRCPQAAAPQAERTVLLRERAARAFECGQNGRQMLRPDIRERHVAARCGSRGQIRRRLHAVRQDRVARAGKRNAAADAQQASLAADVCAAGAQEGDQVADLRLTRGVAQRQCSPAAERRKDEILRCADAWKRQCDRAAVKAVGPGRNMLAVKRDLRTHPAQAAQVQIDRPRAEHAAAGQAQLRRAEAREQRPEEQDGSAHFPHEFCRNI